MKKIFALSTILFAFYQPLYANNNIVSDNECIKHIDSHYNQTSNYLDLHSCQINDDDVKAIVPFAGHYNVSDYDLADNNIGEKGAEELARGFKSVSAVWSLNLNNNHIGDQGLQAIIKANHRMQSLEVDNNNLTGEGMKSIGELKNLYQLTVNNNHINSDGIAEILKLKTGLLALEWLYIEHNDFDLQGVQDLANSGLLRLDIGYNNIGDEGAKILSKNRSIVILSIDGNHITDAGLANISDMDINQGYPFTASDNQITAKGIRVFVDKLQSHRLYSVDFSKNQLGDEGLSILTEMLSLNKIDVSDNQITEKGIDDIVANLPYLDTLIAKNNLIKNSGAKKLAGLQIKHLDLSNNQLDDEGATALAPNNTLQQLMLAHNNIHDSGAIALAKNKTLNTLDVSYNLIDKEGIQSLKANTTIKDLNIEGNPGALK